MDIMQLVVLKMRQKSLSFILRHAKQINSYKDNTRY